jgi:hypothetical protein
VRFNILTAARIPSPILRRVVTYKFTDVSEMLTDFIIALMMESETSVIFYKTTRHNILEDSSLQIVRILCLWENRETKK